MDNYRQFHRIIPRLGLAAIAAIALFAVAILGAPPPAGAQDVQSSDAQSIVVTRYANAAPPAPTAISAEYGTLSWTPGAEPGQMFCMPNCVLQVSVGETTSYVIHSRPIAGETDWQRLGHTTGNPPDTSYTVTQTDHEYRVQACNLGGKQLRCSGWSPVASGMTGLQ